MLEHAKHRMRPNVKYPRRSYPFGNALGHGIGSDKIPKTNTFLSTINPVANTRTWGNAEMNQTIPTFHTSSFKGDQRGAE